MFFERRILSAGLKLASIFNAAAVVIALAAATVSPAENALTNKVTMPVVDLGQRQLNLVRSAPVVDHGVTLGLALVYDDPATPRPEDYLELYDRDGNLVVVAWFDRFGIQRVAVDRAFVEGEDKLEGVFVTVVDESFI